MDLYIYKLQWESDNNSFVFINFWFLYFLKR